MVYAVHLNDGVFPERRPVVAETFDFNSELARLAAREYLITLLFFKSL
jgi:hypothetical protein